MFFVSHERKITNGTCQRKLWRLWVQLHLKPWQDPVQNPLGTRAVRWFFSSWLTTLPCFLIKAYWVFQARFLMRKKEEETFRCQWKGKWESELITQKKSYSILNQCILLLIAEMVVNLSSLFSFNHKSCSSYWHYARIFCFVCDSEVKQNTGKEKYLNGLIYGRPGVTGKISFVSWEFSVFLTHL